MKRGARSRFILRVTKLDQRALALREEDGSVLKKHIHATRRCISEVFVERRVGAARVRRAGRTRCAARAATGAPNDHKVANATIPSVETEIRARRKAVDALRRVERGLHARCDRQRPRVRRTGHGTDPGARTRAVVLHKMASLGLCLGRRPASRHSGRHRRWCA